MASSYMINTCSCVPDMMDLRVLMDGVNMFSAGVYKSPMHGQHGIKAAFYSVTQMKEVLWWDNKLEEGEEEYKGEDEDWWLSSWDQLLDDEDNAMDAIEATGIHSEHAEPMHSITSVKVHLLDKHGEPLTTYNSWGKWAFGDIMTVPMVTNLDHGVSLLKQRDEIPRGMAMYMTAVTADEMLNANMTLVMKFDTRACGAIPFAESDLLIDNCIEVAAAGPVHESSCNAPPVSLWDYMMGWFTEWLGGHGGYDQ